MKIFSPLQANLIEVLEDGHCHSTQQLGKLFKLSRTSIWKQMNNLIAMGLPIQVIAQKGYQLRVPFIPLREQAIRKELNQEENTWFLLHLFTELSSTNQFLKELPPSEIIDICCSESQSQGRGRFGRPWYSPFGENIYCSLRIPIHVPLSQLEGLSLMISFSLLQSLKKQGIQVPLSLKWPNDLYYQDQKLSGCLIEIQAESNGSMQLVIGFGLNVNSDTQKHHLETKDWCSLFSITGRHFDRNVLLAAIIGEIKNNLNVFWSSGFRAFHQQWQKYDYLKEKWITVNQINKQMSGLALGVNEQGQLLIQDVNNEILILTTGDTSIKLE